jgi:hypothetical protein
MDGSSVGKDHNYAAVKMTDPCSFWHEKANVSARVLDTLTTIEPWAVAQAFGIGRASVNRSCRRKHLGIST